MPSDKIEDYADGNTNAHKMAAKQQEISVTEFFEKNKHILGFDSRSKSLLMGIKEAVDNSLDACEEAGFLPDIFVKIDVCFVFRKRKHTRSRSRTTVPGSSTR
ncbi:MAG: hypothetical protein FWC44_01480 [Methanomassiliicoccaceae archaeon]|nr:hypothetical protein [Methanomassiliicoccaceae archaeon]